MKFLSPVALMVVAGACGASVPQSQPGAVSGARAMAHVRKIVGFGPRTVGSAAHHSAQRYIVDTLLSFGYNVEHQSFTASTPDGPREMTNLIGEKSGTSGDVLVLASHYDTKIMDGFVGANDGGSSTGLLLELARVLAARDNRFTLRLVFFDGEEAFGDWTESNSLYGSRYLVDTWRMEDLLDRIHAFILLDMVGDRDLSFKKEFNSSSWLRDRIWESAEAAGHGKHFKDEIVVITDDHVPFVNAGVSAVDLIDFDYGPSNRYWHTRRDTLDKLSEKSLRIVGEVVMETVKRLERDSAGQ